MWFVTPKISCTNTMAPFAFTFGSATYASSSWPSVAFSRIVFPIAVLLREIVDATQLIGEWRPRAVGRCRPKKTGGPRCICGCARPSLEKKALAVGAAEAAVVLGDRLFEAGRDLRRRLRANRRTLGARVILGQPELELLREVDELLELAVDELGVARDAAAQRFGELAHGA